MALARLRDMGVLQQSTVFLLGLAAGMAIVVLAAVVGSRRSGGPRLGLRDLGCTVVTFGVNRDAAPLGIHRAGLRGNRPL